MKIQWAAVICFVILLGSLGLLGLVPNEQLHRTVPILKNMNDKIIHCLAFALLTMNLHWLVWSWRYRWMLVTSCSLSASVVSELVQGISGLRSMEWQDIPWNWFGIVLGSIGCWVIEHLFCRKRGKPEFLSVNVTQFTSFL